jgi:hypothetical protein
MAEDNTNNTNEKAEDGDRNAGENEKNAGEITGAKSDNSAKGAEADGDAKPDLEQVLAQLSAEKNARIKAEKAKIDAETAIDAERRAHAKLKKEHMSESERLAEAQKELEEKAKAYDRQKSRLSAMQALAALGLEENDYADGVDMFVTEDEAKSKDIAAWIADLVKTQAAKAAKAERAKVLKEMPPPTAGKGQDEGQDAFQAAFNEAYQKG